MSSDIIIVWEPVDDRHTRTGIWGVFTDEATARKAMSYFGVEFRMSTYEIDYRYKHRRRIRNADIHFVSRMVER